MLFLAYGITASGIWKDGSGLPNTVNFSNLKDGLLFRSGPGIMWTIPVEFKFYFLLPLIILVCRLSCRLFHSMDLILLFLGIVLSFVILPVKLSGSSPLEFTGVFLTGSFLASLLSRTWFIDLINNNNKIVGGIGTLSIGLLFVTMPKVWSQIFKLDQFVDIHNLQWVTALLWSIIIVCAVTEVHPISRFLEKRFFVFLGSISYSLYLLHYIVIKPLVEISISPLLIGWLSIPLCILLSHISFISIEKPIILKGNRLKKRLDQKALPKHLRN